jgi:hypothetical protein
VNVQKRKIVKPLKKLLASAAVLTCSSAAFALETTVNFQTMADSDWGESAWSKLSLNELGLDVDITGIYNGDTVFAYLDHSGGGNASRSGQAGLGTCRALNSNASSDVKKPSNTSNSCSPSSDDNVNVYDDKGEGLKFTFNQNLTVKEIWFNNNHDPDYGMDGDTVVINGSNHTFGARSNFDLGWLFEFGPEGFTFAPTQMLTIDYFVPGVGSNLLGEEFYISAVVFDDTPRDPDNPVPVPSTLALLGLGIAGLGARKRRK